MFVFLLCLKVFCLDPDATAQNLTVAMTHFLNGAPVDVKYDSVNRLFRCCSGTVSFKDKISAVDSRFGPYAGKGDFDEVREGCCCFQRFVLYLGKEEIDFILIRYVDLASQSPNVAALPYPGGVSALYEKYKDLFPILSDYLSKDKDKAHFMYQFACPENGLKELVIHFSNMNESETMEFAEEILVSGVCGKENNLHIPFERIDEFKGFLTLNLEGNPLGIPFVRSESE